MTKVSNLYYIIHPFFVEKQSSKDRQADLAYWKSVVDRASADPKAAMVILDFYIKSPLHKELQQYAQKKLGNKVSLPLQERSQNWKIDKNARIFACGEVYDNCVKEVAYRQAHKYKIPADRVFLMPDLSYAVKSGPKEPIKSKFATRPLIYPINVLSRLGELNLRRAEMSRKEFENMKLERGFSVIPRTQITKRRKK